MKNVKFLPYACQSISKEDVEAVQAALLNPEITRGPLVENFESAIANYCGAKFAVAFNSGTSALMAAYYAANVGPNDRILSSPNTFVSTIGSGILRGATPVFIDIDSTTGNIDLEQLGFNLGIKSLRGKTVVVPVHFGGTPVNMQALDATISDPNCIVIEDAAHALGSTYRDGQKVGCCAWSHMTMFSFHPAKIMTTGEGGIITTNDPELNHRLRLYRNNGIERAAEFMEEHPHSWSYEVVSYTGNFNFTEMQAALGLSQFQRLESFIQKRQSLLRLYHELLNDRETIKLLDYCAESAPHLCVAQIDFEAHGTSREQVMVALKERGIGTQVHYIPLYRHPVFYKRNGDIQEYFPKMESYYAKALSLPLYYDLEEEEVAFVVKTLKEVL